MAQPNFHSQALIVMQPTRPQRLSWKRTNVSPNPSPTPPSPIVRTLIHPFLCTLLLGAVACAPAAPQQDAPPKQEQKGTPAQLVEPKFDGARAWKDLETIVGLGARPAGSPALESLRAYLTQELTEVGLKVQREDFVDEVPVTPDTPDGRLAFCNLYADLEGSQGKQSPMVIVATHIDTKFLPNFVGANDGGSSTAAVLELARCAQAVSQR